MLTEGKSCILTFYNISACFCVYSALTAGTASAGELEPPATSATTTDDTGNVQPAKRARIGGGGLTAAEILLSSVQNARQQQQIDEVAGYAKEPPADINTNPLAWWKSNGARYPRLAVLALKYLGISSDLVNLLLLTSVLHRRQ